MPGLLLLVKNQSIILQLAAPFTADCLPILDSIEVQHSDGNLPLLPAPKTPEPVPPVIDLRHIKALDLADSDG